MNTRQAGVIGLAVALGYGNRISKRVVDAIGDIAGGIRLKDIQDLTRGDGQ